MTYVKPEDQVRAINTIVNRLWGMPDVAASERCNSHESIDSCEYEDDVTTEEIYHASMSISDILFKAKMYYLERRWEAIEEHLRRYSEDDD